MWNYRTRYTATSQFRPSDNLVECIGALIRCIEDRYTVSHLPKNNPEVLSRIKALTLSIVGDGCLPRVEHVDAATVWSGRPVRSTARRRGPPSATASLGTNEWRAAARTGRPPANRAESPRGEGECPRPESNRRPRFQAPSWVPQSDASHRSPRSGPRALGTQPSEGTANS